MVATLIPFTLQVTATRARAPVKPQTNNAIYATGASVNLTRTVEVALLPAFEFGVFCDTTATISPALTSTSADVYTPTAICSSLPVPSSLYR